MSLEVRHGLARFEIPNELVQEEVGQRQDRGIFETMGIASLKANKTIRKQEKENVAGCLDAKMSQFQTLRRGQSSGSALQSTSEEHVVSRDR